MTNFGPFEELFLLMHALTFKKIADIPGRPPMGVRSYEAVAR